MTSGKKELFKNGALVAVVSAVVSAGAVFALFGSGTQDKIQFEMQEAASAELRDHLYPKAKSFRKAPVFRVHPADHEEKAGVEVYRYSDFVSTEARGSKWVPDSDYQQIVEQFHCPACGHPHEITAGERIQCSCGLIFERDANNTNQLRVWLDEKEPGPDRPDPS